MCQDGKEIKNSDMNTSAEEKNVSQISQGSTDSIESVV